jgi:hypothetical protein
MGEPVNKNNNNIITPALPTASPGYPISLFFAISDILQELPHQGLIELCDHEGQVRITRRGKQRLQLVLNN